MQGRSVGRYLIALVACGLLSGEPSAQEAPSFDKTIENQFHKQQANVPPHDRHPTRLEIVVQNDTRTSVYDKDVIEYYKERIQKESDWWHAFFYDIKITDVLLSAFTLFLVIYTRGLDRSTKRLWEAGERQIGLIERSTASAVNSAKTAEKTLALSNKVAQIQLRAYVNSDSITESIVVNQDQSFAGFTISRVWKNSGETPARQCRSKIFRAITKIIDPTEVDLDFQYTTPSRDFTIEIGAGEDISSDSVFFNPFEIEEIRLKRNTAFVHAAMSYTDVFGNIFQSNQCVQIICNMTFAEYKKTGMNGYFFVYRYAPFKNLVI